MEAAEDAASPDVYADVYADVDADAAKDTTNLSQIVYTIKLYIHI